MRAPDGARGEQSSDCEGRRPGAVGLGRAGGEGAEMRRRADRTASGVEPVWQGRGIGRDERRRLSDESAQRTLVVAMIAGTVRRGRALVVDMGAEGRGVAENRLEISGDRRRIVAQNRPGERLLVGHGDQLDEEAERDDERGQSRVQRNPPIATSPRSTPGFSAAAQLTIPSPAPDFRSAPLP